MNTKTNLFRLALLLCLGFVMTACQSYDLSEEIVEEALHANEPMLDEPMFKDAELIKDSIDGTWRYTPIELNEAQKKMVDAYNEFALNLAYALQDGDNKENLLFSPLSVTTSLSMYANAASGATLSEIVNTLGGGKISSLDELNKFNQWLCETIQNVDPGTRLEMANALWFNNNQTLSSGFFNALTAHYKGNFFQTNLHSEQGKNDINKWVYNHTGGLISNALKKVPTSNITLVSSVGFKAFWDQAWVLKMGQERTFYTAQNTMSTIHMMRATAAFQNHYEDGNVDVFDSFLGNWGLSLMFIAPKDKQGVNLQRLFNQTSYQKLITELPTNKLVYNFQRVNQDTTRYPAINTTLEIPRFKIEGRVSLNRALEKLGMKNAFSKSGILSEVGLTGEGISMEPTACLEIDENGICTSTRSINPLALPRGSELFGIVPEGCHTFDHPFAFVIKDVSTGAIIFIGVVNNL